MSSKIAEVKITGLEQYPLKAAKGIPLDAAILADKGFKLDRRWVIIDSAGNFQSQRNRPELSQLEVSSELCGGVALTHKSQNEPCHLIDLTHGVQRIVTLHGKTYRGIDAGEAAANWITNVLGTDAHGRQFRIAQFDRSHRRDIVISEREEHETEFSDAFPYLLCTEESLADVNLRLEAKSLPQVSMNCFRPNIVIAGTTAVLEAFAEYQFKDLIRIDGLVHFSLVKPCQRCVVTTVDQATGEVPVKGEPLKTLAELSVPDANGAFFGVNMVLYRGVAETIRKDDIFYLSE